MRNERDVKATAKAIIKRHGGWYTMPVQMGYGAQGVPDILACVRGRFVAVETKFGYNKPTALQRQQLAGIQNAEGLSLVINENNFEILEEALRRIPSAGGEAGEDEA